MSLVTAMDGPGNSEGPRGKTATASYANTVWLYKD